MKTSGGASGGYRGGPRPAGYRYATFAPTVVDEQVSAVNPIKSPPKGCLKGEDRKRKRKKKKEIEKESAQFLVSKRDRHPLL